MSFVTLEQQGPIGIITMNRPEALNALNDQVLRELDGVLDQVAANEEILVAVVTGAGRSFVAGADIAQMSDLTPAQARAFGELGNNVFLKLENLEKPTIAAVNGFAPLDGTGAITNTATLVTDADCADGTATATVTAASAADVSVLKQMSPNPVVCGDTVTYTIRIYNYGNAPAEDVQLVDAFDPAPTSITVSRNGELLPATGYTYDGGVLTVPPTGGTLDTVPAATFTRDATTGEVIVTPGVVEYVITGVI